MRRLTAPLALLAALLAVLAASPAGAQRTGERRATAGPALPAGFVGMNIDGPALGPQVDLGGEMSYMAATGVGRVRVAFFWSEAQPYRSAAAAPTSSRARNWDRVDGIPTNWDPTDAVVSDAAARGLTVLPVVLGAPGWDAEHPRAPVSPPKRLAPYTDFLRALIARYGPNGSFWALHPDLPRSPLGWWQVWNEPDHRFYWQDSPWVPGYVRLLRAAHDAIKAADPHATVVLAGTPDFSYRYLDEMYQAGARPSFDLVAEHPYTHTPSHVIKILRRVRSVMDAHGDRGKPMIATEISFPSSQGKARQYGFETDEAGQARNTATVIKLLVGARRSLHLLAFYYYTWMGDEHPGALSFAYAGLLRFRNGAVTAKPSYSAFRETVLGLEGCRSHGPVVGDCTH